MKQSGKENPNFRVSRWKWLNHNPCFLFLVAAVAVLHLQSWKIEVSKGRLRLVISHIYQYVPYAFIHLHACGRFRELCISTHVKAGNMHFSCNYI